MEAECELTDYAKEELAKAKTEMEEDYTNFEEL